jgi:hypothetical protein
VVAGDQPGRAAEGDLLDARVVSPGNVRVSDDHVIRAEHHQPGGAVPGALGDNRDAAGGRLAGGKRDRAAVAARAEPGRRDVTRRRPRLSSAVQQAADRHE